MSDKKCVVCDDPAPSFKWSDYHGEGMCTRCGAPYNLKDEERPVNLKPEGVELAREYWGETQAYMGLGMILLWQDYPREWEGRKAFMAWVKERHPEHIKEEAA
jgi:hypothetical protein